MDSKGYNVLDFDNRVVVDDRGVEGSLRDPKGGPSWLLDVQSTEMRRIFSAVSFAASTGHMPENKMMAKLYQQKMDDAERKAKMEAVNKRTHTMPMPVTSRMTGRQLATALPGDRSYLQSYSAVVHKSRRQLEAEAKAQREADEEARRAKKKGGSRPGTRPGTAAAVSRDKAAADATASPPRPKTAPSPTKGATGSPSMRQAMREFDSAHGGGRPGQVASPMINNIQQTLRVSRSLQGSRPGTAGGRSRPSSSSSFRTLESSLYDDGEPLPMGDDDDDSVVAKQFVVDGRRHTSMPPGTELLTDPPPYYHFLDSRPTTASTRGGAGGAGGGSRPQSAKSRATVSFVDDDDSRPTTPDFESRQRRIEAAAVNGRLPSPGLRRKRRPRSALPRSDSGRNMDKMTMMEQFEESQRQRAERLEERDQPWPASPGYWSAPPRADPPKRPSTAPSNRRVTEYGEEGEELVVGTSSKGGKFSGAPIRASHITTHKYQAGVWDPVKYPKKMMPQDAIDDAKAKASREMDRRADARGAALVKGASQRGLREYGSDLTRSLPRGGPGLIQGTLIVGHKVLAEASSVARTWGQVTATEGTDEGCALKLRLLPADYEGFVDELDRVTGGDFQFIANMTATGYTGPVVEEDTGPLEFTNAFGDPYGRVKKREAPKKEVAVDEHGNPIDLEMARKVTETITSHQEVEARERARRARQAIKDEFIKAAEDGNGGYLVHLVKVGKLVEGPGGRRVKVDLNYTRPEDNMNALMIACKNCNDKLCKELLNMGIDRRRRNSKGKSAFQIAREAQAKAQVDVKLGAAGAGLRARGSSNCVKMLEDRSVLEVAQDGDMKRLRYLVVTKGDDPKVPNAYGMTTLHFAALNHDLEMVTFLIKKDVDPTFKNNLGQSPLIIAEANRDELLVKAMKKHKRYQSNVEEEKRAEKEAKQELRVKALAVEMRQYTRGTPAAVQVYRAYERPGIGWYRKGKKKIEDAAKRVDKPLTLASMKAKGRGRGRGSGMGPVKPKPKPPPPKKTAAPPGTGTETPGSRYMFHQARKQSSKAIASTLRHSGSLSNPHLPDQATMSANRHQRRYLGASAASILTMPPDSPLVRALRAEHKAHADKIPSPNNSRFEDWLRMKYGSV